VEALFWEPAGYAIRRMSFFKTNIVGFRRVYYKLVSQSPGKVQWVPALSRQHRSLLEVARWPMTRLLDEALGGNMLNRGEWLGEDARDQIQELLKRI
jgi:hypothetical protein